MRLKYYKLTFRQMDLKRPFVFLVIVITVIIVSMNLYSFKLKPVILNACSGNAEQLAFEITSLSVEENMKNISYDSLIDIQKDNNGKIIALTSKVVEMNKLSTNIISSIRERFNDNPTSKIKLPMGIFSESMIFSAYGPKITVKTVLYR